MDTNEKTIGTGYEHLQCTEKLYLKIWSVHRVEQKLSLHQVKNEWTRLEANSLSNNERGFPGYEK